RGDLGRGKSLAIAPIPTSEIWGRAEPKNNILPAAVRSGAPPKNLHIFTHLSVRLHVSAACSCEQPAYVPVGTAVLGIRSRAVAQLAFAFYLPTCLGYRFTGPRDARPAQDTINTTAAVPRGVAILP